MTIQDGVEKNQHKKQCPHSKSDNMTREILWDNESQRQVEM